MTGFENMKDETSLQYSTGGRAGYLLFEVDEPEGRLVSNNFTKDDGTIPTNNDHRTYVIAMPYTTNLKHTGQGGQHEYTRAKLDTTATVYFGNRGELDYSWSRGDLRHDPFQIRNVTFTQHKSAIDMPSGGRSVSYPYAANAYLGLDASYVIDQMHLASNVPIFSPLVDPSTGYAITDPDTTGPMLVDQLPDRFTLTGIDITMPKQTIKSPITGLKDTELSDWYNTKSGVVEAETIDGLGVTSWKTLGNPDLIDDDGINLTWRLGNADPTSLDPGIDDMLSGQGVNPTPGSTTGVRFTGKFRLNFVYSLYKNTDVPGSITVHGLMEDAGKPDSPQRYENSVNLEYGMRMWNNEPSDAAIDGFYNVTADKSAESKAILQPLPTEPAVDARSFTKSTGPADMSVDESKKTTDSILNQAGAGYRFHLSNSSVSEMIPAVIDVHTLYGTNSAAQRWFNTSDITFSADMLKHMKLNKIEFNVYGYSWGVWVPSTVAVGWSTLESRGSYDAAGNFTFDPSAWGDKALAGFKVYTDKVDGQMPASDEDAFVEVRGTPTDKASMPLTCTFETDYEYPDWNKSASDTATIVGVTPPFRPVVVADSYTGATQPADPSVALNNVTSVPIDSQTSGWRFSLTNNTNFDIMPAIFTAGPMRRDQNSSWPEGQRGFVTSDVALSAGLLANSTIDSVAITYFENGRDTTSKSVTLTSADIVGLNKDGAGNIIIPQSAWNNGYLSEIGVSFAQFNSNVTNDSNAFIDFFGKATLMLYGDGKLLDDSNSYLKIDSRFASNYADPDWNVESRDPAYMRPFTVDGNVGINFTWTNDKGEQTHDAVPYRWGDEDSEQAWYSYSINNRSSVQGRDYIATLTLNGVQKIAADGAERGFIADRVEIDGFDPATGDLLTGKVSSIDLIYQTGEELTGIPSTWRTVSLPKASYLSLIDSNGMLVLPRSSWSDDYPLARVVINYDVFYGSTTAQATTARIYGAVDTHGSKVDTLDQYMSSNITLSTTSTLFGTQQTRSADRSQPIAQFDFNQTAVAYKPAAIRPVSNSEVVGGNVEVANEAHGVGYRFNVANSTLARSDETSLTLNIGSVSNKLTSNTATGTPQIRGFKTEHLTVSGDLYDLGSVPNVAGSESFVGISFFFMDNPASTVPSTPQVTLSRSDLEAFYNAATDQWVFDLASDAIFASVKGLYLVDVKLDYAQIDPSCVKKSLAFDFEGESDWFDSLWGTISWEQTGVYDTKNSDYSTACLRVERPALAIHTFGRYAEQDETEHTYSKSANSDGDRTHVTTPYDRDFILWTRIENERGISKLDDIDFTTAIPIAWESGISTISGAPTSAFTGFHVTRMTIQKPLFECFSHGKIGAIELAGWKETDFGSSPQTHITLNPVFKDGEGLEIDSDHYTGGLPTHYQASDGTLFPVTNEGLVLDEGQLRDLGIAYLANVSFISWKDMEVDSVNAENQCIVFNGFSDAAFDSLHMYTANSENHLECFRTYTPADDDYAVRRYDDTSVYMSRMYYDLVSRSAYYDGGNNQTGSDRFQNYTHASDDTCHWFHVFGTDGEYDNTLEVGYKTQGSFLLDFRQNAADPEYTCHTEQGYRTMPDDGRQYLTSTIDGKTYNTGAHVSMTTTLPTDHFDAYYLKVRSAALPYLSGITVTYQSGKTIYVSKEDISREYASGSAFSRQTDIDGNKYFRVNLLKRNADDPVVSYGDINEDAYRDPYEAYDEQDEPTKYDLVSAIKWDIVINQDQYTTGANRFLDETFMPQTGEGVNAGTADYGRWFGDVIYKDDPNWINMMAFEVSGRFYKATDLNNNIDREDVRCVSEANITMGGDYSGNKRGGVKAIIRYDEPGSDHKGAWTGYQDYHYTGGSHSHDAARMRHLRTYDPVNVIQDLPRILKGVTTNTPSGNDGNESVKFADDQRFYVNFFREKQPLSFDAYDRRRPSNWDNKISFADRIMLADDFPQCFPDWDLRYYGWLTTGLQINANSSVMRHIDPDQYPKASLTFTFAQWEKDSDPATTYHQSSTRTLVIRSDGTYELKPDGSEEKLNDHGLRELVSANKDVAGNAIIAFVHPDETNASEVVAMQQAGGAPFVIDLSVDEFVTRYEIDLGHYNGNGNVTSETDGAYDPEWGTSGPDLTIFGRPYAYKGQLNPRTGASTALQDSTNTTYTYQYNYQSSDFYSAHPVQNKGLNLYSDQAYYLGYLIPYGYYASLQAENNTSTTVSIKDYAADNNTPNHATYEARFWNISDQHAGVDDAGRASHINHATLSSSIDPAFRLQTIKIPRQLIADDEFNTWEDRTTVFDSSTGQEQEVVIKQNNWFVMKTLSFVANGKTITKTWDQLLADGVVTVPAAGDVNGEYAVSIEKYLREDQTLVSTYQGLLTTNTLADHSGDPNVDIIYAAPSVSRITLDYDAPHADRAKPASMLDSGQYLAKDRNNNGYAFTYDGIFVDRPVDDFRADAAYNRYSTPSFGKHTESFPSHASRHTLSVTNVETKDPNHASLSSHLNDPHAEYNVSHTVGNMEISYTRGKKLEDGTQIFAYDKDDRSITAPVSFGSQTAASNNIPDGGLYSGDYVEYELYVGAKSSSPLPLEHINARFTTSKGQRIVGWEVAKVQNTDGTWSERNTTQGSDGKPLRVTAQIADTNGASSQVAPEAQDLTRMPTTGAALDGEGIAFTNGSERFEENRTLMFSLGDDPVDDTGLRTDPDATQVHPGQGVYIRVITQMTDELETKADYNTTENESFNGDADKPSYSDAEVWANFYATSAPKHDYVQMRVENCASSLSSGVHRYTELDGDAALRNIYYDRGLGVWADNEQDSASHRKTQYGAQAYSAVRFYNHRYDRTRGGVDHYTDSKVSAAFTGSPTHATERTDIDGAPVDITISNVINTTWHAADISAGIMFTEGSDENGNPVGKRIFELTDIPRKTNGDPVGYPASIPSNEVGPDKDNPGRPALAVQFYLQGMGWVEYDTLVSEMAKRPPTTSESGHLINTNLYRDVYAVRGVYFDVPATLDGAMPYPLDDVVFSGVARYADTRTPTASLQEQLNSWVGNILVSTGYTHRHNETTTTDLATIDETGTLVPTKTQAIEHGTLLTKQDEYDATQMTVYRETPVLRFQNQVFQTQEQASAPYNKDAAQKTGYIPGEQFFYKNTLRNSYRGENAGMGDLEGDLYNPVFYERIPVDYLTTEGRQQIDAAYLEAKIQNSISWVDGDGVDVLNSRTRGMRLQVTLIDEKKALDYGGAVEYDRKGSNGSYRSFADLKMTEDNVDATTFKLFRVEWINDGSAVGSEVDPSRETLHPIDEIAPGSTRMEPGDQISFDFPVRAAIDGLPLVRAEYGDGVSAAFLPRMAEYAVGPYVSPLNPIGESFASEGGRSGVTFINTSHDLMDMDSLIHESAFSGDKPDDTDLWEAFDGTYTYIPGSSVNDRNSSYTGQYGDNDTFLDEDSKTARTYQETRYTPTVGSGNKNEDGSTANRNNAYLRTVTNDKSGQVRDVDDVVVRPRTQEICPVNVAGATTPLVWSQTRVHMQKAWLATSSELIAPTDTSDYASARHYTRGSDPQKTTADWYRPEDPYTYTNRDMRGIAYGQHQTALQYNEDFTSRMTAYNYGDRTLDGVEFTYVMPRGTEPVMNDDGSIAGLKAQILAKTPTVGNFMYDPYSSLSSEWGDIDLSKVSVEIVQTPYGEYKGYDAPSASQDPVENEEGSVDRNKSTYVPLASTSSDNTSTEYLESSQPWVLKITVHQDLGKWFGRAIDKQAANAADPDDYDEGGYQIRVDFTGHVFANNENEGWYDRVLTRPVDDPQTGEDSKASAYYQVYDGDYFEGSELSKNM